MASSIETVESIAVGACLVVLIERRIPGPAAAAEIDASVFEADLDQEQTLTGPSTIMDIYKYGDFDDDATLATSLSPAFSPAEVPALEDLEFAPFLDECKFDICKVSTINRRISNELEPDAIAVRWGLPVHAAAKIGGNSYADLPAMCQGKSYSFHQNRPEQHVGPEILSTQHRGFLPPLLDFPHQAALRQRAVELRTTQVIQSFLVNTLRPDADRSKVRQICLTAVSVCVQAQLWPVLHKTVFECFKATGHMHVYCASLEPFILDARIPRAEMDSEVLSSILQSYTLPLQEEEQEASRLHMHAGEPCAFVDCDHFPELFPVARRLQQLVLCVDVAKLDLNLAIRLFTHHRLWTALVHVYCALGDYVTPLELLVGECVQLAKACTPTCAFSEEAPLLQCRLVRKLFFFLHQCFELRPFPLDSKDVAVPQSAITDLLACIFKVPPDPSQQVPPMFQRLLRLSSLGLFRTLSLLFTSPSGSRAVHQGDWSGQEDGGLASLFHLIRSSLDAVKENSPLSAHTQKEYLWFVARSVPRAKPQLSVEEVAQVVDHLLSWPVKGRRQRSEAEQLLIGVLATQDFDSSQLDVIIAKAMTDFLGLAAWLHERRGEFGKALDCRLQEPELREQIFEYIITKLDEVGAPLVEATLQRLQELVDVDKERCSLMLCEQFATADHALVLECLKQFPQMEMNYFEALFSRRFGLADRQAFFNEHVVHYIDLLCQNCPEAVLPFILENEALPLRECLELCSRYGVTDASVHLLERTGDFASVLQPTPKQSSEASLCIAGAIMFRSVFKSGRTLRAVAAAGAAGATGAAGLALWAPQERKQKSGPLTAPLQCETDAAALGAAVLGGLALGGAGGYLFGKSQAEARTERYEKYWPRKIMMLFGAPGAGKGTQGPKIVETLDVPQLSTGDMLREAVANGTEVGKKAKAIMSSGGLVSDDIVIGIIADRIKEPDCKAGFILDGFPRTLAQAKALDTMLAKSGENVSLILEFAVDPKMLEERICGRWMHKASGRSYHVRSCPPKSMKLGADGKPVPETMKDDITGEALYQRSDDTAEALKTRLDAYKNQTLPILEHYKDKGIVKQVDGGKGITEVWAEVSSLVLNDCRDAMEKLCVSFAGQQGADRSAVSKVRSWMRSRETPERELFCDSSKAVKRLLNGAEAWYEGFPEAQKCMRIFQNAYELTSRPPHDSIQLGQYPFSRVRNSNIMTEAQLEELWFGILGLTVRKQESLHGGCIGGSERGRRLGLGLALQELASKAMTAVLAYLSLPRCLKWMCAEFGQSTLGTWKGPLQSMLSGLGFQQGLLKAATAVAAQDVMRPFIVLKVCGSRGALVAPRRAGGCRI
ncbi:ADK-B [Symbiodinium sp. CCMP2592]|nr:ADK-B [Symbiodinium sp. CCMP2592]